MTTPAGAPVAALPQPPTGPAAPTQYAAVQAPPLTPTAERRWAVGAHLSGFLAAWVALGFVGPLVAMLAIGDRSPFARRHAVEALNFNLSWLIWTTVAGLLAVVLIGIPLLIALGVAYLVLVIVAAAEAGGGREFRYPLTIRIVR